MAFHELASNAAKYGALSTDSGSVAVSWTIGYGSGATLNFVWQETGGPPIDGPPVRRGFGSILIERTLTHEMDAVVTRQFRPSGLCCQIDILLTNDIGDLATVVASFLACVCEQTKLDGSINGILARR